MKFKEGTPYRGTHGTWDIGTPPRRVADQVEVWSQTAHSWLPAVVARVRDDDTLEVAYHHGQAGERWKDLPRFDPELRPFWPTRGVG